MKTIKNSPINLPKAAALAGVSILSAGLSGLALADHHNSEGPTELESGYETADKSATEGKCGEGKCGEGKCGGDSKADAEGKCGEGKCGGDSKADAEGKCGEGKCGEGKCGGAA